MSVVNLYYCHSPICAHLALQYAKSVGNTEKHVFMTARNTNISRASFILKNDVMTDKVDFLSYVHDITHFIKGICDEGDHLRVFVPHSGTIIVRMLVFHARVNSVYFIEEGSAYYIAEPDSFSFIWPNFIESLGLTQQDIVDITRSLGRSAEQQAAVASLLFENFFLFQDISGRVAGLLVTDENALANLSYRGRLHVVVEPLTPLYNADLEKTVLYLLPSHHGLMQKHNVTIEDVVRVQKETLRSLIMQYDRVVIKPHPSDMAMWSAIASEYTITSQVVPYDQVHLTGPDGRPFEGEWGVFNFAGFYVGSSSCRMYVNRLWGEERLLDKVTGLRFPLHERRVTHAQMAEKPFLYAYPSAFICLSGVGEAMAAKILQGAGLRYTQSASLYPSSGSVLPAGTFRIENGLACATQTPPMVSSIFFTRAIEDCLCMILWELVQHTYGEQVPPMVAALLAQPDDHARMLRFLADFGEGIIKSKLFGPMVKWLFNPGVLRLRGEELDAPEDSDVYKATLLKIREHLHLPVVASAEHGSAALAVSHDALRKRYWNNVVEEKFVRMGGRKIQAFYDFDRNSPGPLDSFVGHWIMMDSTIIQIFPTGYVHAQTGLNGQAYVDQAGHLVVRWNALPLVYFLTLADSDACKLQGWTNQAADISAQRW